MSIYGIWTLCVHIWKKYGNMDQDHPWSRSRSRNRTEAAKEEPVDSLIQYSFQWLYNKMCALPLPEVLGDFEDAIRNIRLDVHRKDTIQKVCKEMISLKRQLTTQNNISFKEVQPNAIYHVRMALYRTTLTR